ncbi:MAG: stage V sporulation protein AD [Oscillospiraceae bacterium]|nr:stage V sporulation protein AD [Oscillospiraceae bacterium]
MSKHTGQQTVAFSSPPCIISEAAVVGSKEGEGPLRERFDIISRDSYFGQKSWEKAESTMLRKCFDLAVSKASISPKQIKYLLAGDLLNQCTSSAFALRDSGLPFFGLYGACSTMGESLSLAAMLVDGGFADCVCAMTSSHFCSAERQFRLPLEYGGQRSPTAQWTVTGAGALILASKGKGPRVTHVTVGKIVDAGITDGSNMGAAMAPAALDTLLAHFRDTGRSPTYYDAIISGDLGAFGHSILAELLEKEGLKMPKVFTDCGLLIFNRTKQDTHCGGSGCGCAASVLCGHILKCLREGIWKRVLFAPTGALMSPTSSMQGESIPGICHAAAIEMRED